MNNRLINADGWVEGESNKGLATGSCLEDGIKESYTGFQHDSWKINDWSMNNSEKRRGKWCKRKRSNQVNTVRSESVERWTQQANTRYESHFTLSHELREAHLTVLNPCMFMNTREGHSILRGRETIWAIDQLPVIWNMDSMKLQRNFFTIFFKLTFKLFFSLMKSFYFNKDFDVSGGIKGVFKTCIKQFQPFTLLLIEDLLLIM